MEVTGKPRELKKRSPDVPIRCAPDVPISHNNHNKTN